MDWTGQILNASIIAALTMAVEHYFPWPLLLRRPLPLIARYILGVVGFLVPVSVLFAGGFGETTPTDHWQYLIGLWAVISAAGGAVVFCYGIDWIAERIARSYEMSELYEARKNGDEDETR